MGRMKMETAHAFCFCVVTPLPFLSDAGAPFPSHRQLTFIHWYSDEVINV